MMNVDAVLLICWWTDHCRAGRNFNAMFAILSGLGHGSVTRLKQTWDKLPAKYIKLFEVMTTVLLTEKFILYVLSILGLYCSLFVNTWQYFSISLLVFFTDNTAGNCTCNATLLSLFSVTDFITETFDFSLRSHNLLLRFQLSNPKFCTTFINCYFTSTAQCTRCRSSSTWRQPAPH